jgi:hypothetical protein
MLEYVPSESRSLKSDFDIKKVNLIIGKYVVVGLDYQDKRGNLLPEKRRQLHGRIKSADPKNGFCLALGGKDEGKEFWLPPITNAFKKARRGTYHLKNTNEEVEDPDLTSQWVITISNK